MSYTPGKVRFLLQSYQSLAQGARISPREDRLGTRPPPLDEAPYCSSSRQKADIEMALRSLGFERMQIVFMVLCQGESSWRHAGVNGDRETKRYNWRKRVAEWWGMTPGDANKIVSESIQEMCDTLNGSAVDNAPVDESIRV